MANVYPFKLGVGLMPALRILGAECSDLDPVLFGVNSKPSACLIVRDQMAPPGRKMALIGSELRKKPLGAWSFWSGGQPPTCVSSRLVGHSAPWLQFPKFLKWKTQKVLFCGNKNLVIQRSRKSKTAEICPLPPPLYLVSLLGSPRYPASGSSRAKGSEILCL